VIGFPLIIASPLRVRLTVCLAARAVPRRTRCAVCAVTAFSHGDCAWATAGARSSATLASWTRTYGSFRRALFRMDVLVRLSQRSGTNASTAASEMRRIGNDGPGGLCRRAHCAVGDGPPLVIAAGEPKYPSGRHGREYASARERLRVARPSVQVARARSSP
jgi:hypothetical protein